MEISFSRGFDFAGRKSRRKTQGKSRKSSRKSRVRSTVGQKSRRQSGRRVHVALHPGGFQDDHEEHNDRRKQTARTSHYDSSDFKDSKASIEKLTTEVRPSYISRIAKLLDVSNDLRLAKSERDRLGGMMAEARDMERWKSLARCYAEQRSLQADVVELEQLRTELFLRWGGAFIDSGVIGSPSKENPVELFSSIDADEARVALESFLNSPGDETKPTKAERKADDDLSLMSRMIDLRATGLVTPSENEMWQRILALAPTNKSRGPSPVELPDDFHLSEVLLSYDMDPDDRSSMALMKLAYLTGTDPFELAMQGSPYESALALENTFSLDITLSEREQRCRNNVLQLRERKETISRHLSTFRERIQGQSIPDRKEKNIYTEWLRLRNWQLWRIRNIADQNTPAKEKRRKFVEARARTWADLWTLVRDVEAERGRLASLELEERDQRNSWDELKEKCSKVAKTLTENINLGEQRLRELFKEDAPEDEKKARNLLGLRLLKEIESARAAIQENTLRYAQKPIAEPEELAWYSMSVGKTEKEDLAVSAKPEYETYDLLDKSASELLDELLRVKAHYESFSRKYQEGEGVLQDDGFDILDKLHIVYVLFMNRKQLLQGRVDALKQVPGTGEITQVAANFHRFLKTTQPDALPASIEAYKQQQAKAKENAEAARRRAANNFTTKTPAGSEEQMADSLSRTQSADDISSASQVQAAEKDMADTLDKQIKETEAAQGMAKRLMEDIELQKLKDAKEQAKLREKINELQDELNNERQRRKEDFQTASDEGRKRAEATLLEREESLGNQITELRKALQEASVRDALMDKALDDARKESRQKQAEISELHRKLNDITKAAAEANAKIADLLRQRDRENAAQEQVRAEREKSNAAHEKMVADLQAKLSERGADVRVLRAELDKVTKSHSKELESLQKILTDEAAKTLTAENAAKAAGKEIGELRDALSRQKEISHQIQLNLDSSRNEVLSLQKKVEELKSLRVEDAGKRAELTTALRKTEEHLKNAERRMREAEQTANKYKALVKTREDERDKVLQSLRDAEKMIIRGEEREKEIRGKLSETERTVEVLEEKVQTTAQKLADVTARKAAEDQQHEKEIRERGQVIKQLQMKEKVSDQELRRLEEQARKQAEVIRTSHGLLQASRENEKRLQETSKALEREALAAREEGARISRKLQEAINAGKAERALLEKASEVANARADVAEKERARIQTELQDASRMVANLKEEVQTVTAEMRNRIAAHEGSLKAEMEKARLKDIEHKVATDELLRVIEGERATIKTLTREHAEKETVISALRGELVIAEKEKQALSSEVQALKETVSGLEKANQVKAAEIKRLEEVITERNGVLQGTTLKLREAEAKRDELVKEVQHGLQRQKVLNDTVSALQTTVSQGETKLTNLREEIKTRSEEFSRREAALQEKILRADNEIAVSRGVIDALKRNREDELLARARLEEQIAAITSDLQKEKDALKKTTEDLRSVSQKLEQTEHLRSEAAKEAQELRDTVGKLQAQLTAEQERARDLESANKDLRADMEKLQVALVQKHSETEALRKKGELLAQTCRDHEVSLTDVRSELQSVRGDLADKERRIEAVVQQRDQLKTVMEEAQRQGDIRAAVLGDRITELERKAADLTKERGELQGSLQRLQLHLTENERQLVEAIQSLKETQMTRDQYKEVGMRLQEELGRAQEKVSELEDIVQDLQEESTQAKYDYDIMNEMFQRSEFRVAELLQQKDRLMQEGAALLSERDQLLSVRDQLLYDRNELKAYGENSRRQLVDCRKELAKFTGTNALRPEPLPRLRLP